MAPKKESAGNWRSREREAARQLKALERELRKSEKSATDAKLKAADLERRIRLLETEGDIYRQVARVTGKDFDLDKLLGHYMDLILYATKTEAGTLYLLREETEELEFRVVRGPAQKKLTGRTIPATEGIAGWVIRTGTPYVATDPQRDKKWSRRISNEINFETHDILCVPLKTKRRNIGAIEVINKEGEEPFGKSDLEALTTLSGQIAVVLENAHLFDHSRRQAQQFATLAELSAILNSNLDSKKVQTAAMEAITRLLECEVGSLLVVDAEKDELYFEVALGEKGDVVKEIRLKMGEGIAGWVAKNAEPVLIPDASKDSRWASRFDKKSKFQTRNMVCVPVCSHDKVIGVLQAINKISKSFDEQDLDLLEALSHPVAIALDNAMLYEEQREMFFETAEALAEAIEKRDLYTGGHTKRVSEYSITIGKYLPLSEEDRNWLHLAAILHDVGKIGVPEDILNKPGRLEKHEYLEMTRHPQYGYEILHHIRKMDKAVPGMRSHHERYDGKGYPDKIKGETIPLIARIISVADTFDAMTTDRPYRKALSDKEALRELRKYRGEQFDSQVVKAFLKAYKKGEIISQNKEV